MSVLYTDPAPRAERLELALEAGLTLPSAGMIAVFHPRAGESLAPLPRQRVQIVTPHFPDHAAFTAQGYACGREAQAGAAAAMVCLPRARTEAQDLLARACAATAGPVIVDGQKTDGIEAMLRALRARAPIAGTLSKAHGKIFWFPSPGAEALADWHCASTKVSDAGGRVFRTVPGLFSADAIDPGSALLAATLPGDLVGEAADLGAGWGFLSVQLLERASRITRLHLIESDARALDCARHNTTDPRAVFHWADATLPMPGLQADLIVTNPPFHTGRNAKPGLGIAFIRAAAALLRPEGQLWLVANRHLPYEAALSASFRRHTEVAGSAAFKVLCAEAPVRTIAARPEPGRDRRSVSHSRGGRR